MNRVISLSLLAIFLLVSIEIPFGVLNKDAGMTCGRVSNCPCELYLEMKYHKETQALGSVINLKTYPKFRKTSENTYAKSFSFEKETYSEGNLLTLNFKKDKHKWFLNQIFNLRTITYPPLPQPPQAPLLFS